ncbi:DNA-directed primase/polymerase protein-like [Daktulosphaira vitifoliae]|uniref:DNA-directed primase/polymerase protein-like n=1 Tax=Daktulosphaira vitifoliae TaxID=58002 RepID=UPI0021AA791F|nr:DNA-directed primase/polymerase protein-like [Daktulosphaira vitifoliae]
MSGLTTTNFYGSRKHNSEITSPSLSSLSKVRREQCHFLNIKRLQGPPIGWKVFPRQHEAIKYASIKANGCMTFTYEQSTGQRAFMVAHPETFWYYDSIRPFNKRHTYEIITENHPCKLYFDIEFEYKENLNSNGIQMLETFDQSECHSSYSQSPYPKIDKFISNLIFPGKIFRYHYFPSANKLVYSIIKNRYCGNVKRQHKRYKSNGTKLPDEIYFEYAKTSIDNLSDSKLLEVANTVFINE